jgi:hypothetical protein
MSILIRTWPEQNLQRIDACQVTILSVAGMGGAERHVSIQNDSGLAQLEI